MDPDIVRRIMRMSISVLAFLEKAAEMDRMDLRGDYFVPSDDFFAYANPEASTAKEGVLIKLADVRFRG